MLLHKLLQLYQATSNWPKMIESLQTIAELETNPERKSKYIYTMAQIYRDKEEDLDRAVEAFNETLDLNPFFLEAFERINKILTQQKDWKQLERAFRKMLHRVAGKGNADLEYNLWHNLGLIYRDRLNDLSPGIEAFKMAARFKPDELRRAADLGRALRDDRAGRSGHRRAAADPREATRCASTRTARSTGCTCAAAVRSGMVHVPGARVPAARPTKTSRSSSRTTAPRACCR